MLKSIKVSNFYSIGTEQAISFEITPAEMLDDSACIVTDKARLNLISCVVGHNGSGKTNILRAIGFVFCWIENAYTRLKSDEFIFLHTHKMKLGHPTRIEIEFYNHNISYSYFIEFGWKEIVKERLSKKNKRTIIIFEVSRESANNFSFKVPGLKINETDAKRFQERKNVPLLSSLVSTGYLSEIDFFKKFQSNIDYDNGLMEFRPYSRGIRSEKLYHNPLLRKEIIDLSNYIDFGISDLNFHEIDEEKKYLLCQHSSTATNFQLHLFNESHGTQLGFSLLCEILPILKTGGVVVLDEIEAGLHPMVVKKIISLFASPETNPHHAQLIFSTHQHLLLNDRTKTQIFIAEKDRETFETEIYRLDDVENVRNDENFFHKYLAGAYGGTPDIKWL